MMTTEQLAIRTTTWAMRVIGTERNVEYGMLNDIGMLEYWI